MSSKKKTRKSSKKSSKLKVYEDKDYKFKYNEIHYKNKTNPYLEIVRHNKWNKIIDESVEILKEKKITLKSSKKSLRQIVSDNLAMWISINLMTKKKLDDPIIPSNAKLNDVFIKTLVYLGKINIQKSKESFKKMDIAKKCNKIVKEIKRENNEPYNNVFFIKNKLIYKDAKFTKKIYCSNNLYHHLKKRYIKNITSKEDKIEFHNKIFCLLLRYKTLMGNSHQFAMNTDFKDALRKEYNINMECFASSINVHYDKYCSMFYDIEKDFGSYGNFYLIKYIKGFYIANPPYENYMLELMVKKFIDSCKESKEPLSISFGMPNWGKYDKFTAMDILDKSTYLKFKRCMKDREVYWFDKLNNIRITIPSHCRCVVQNELGTKEHDISKFNGLINKHWVIKK
jgi:hypothetical protein